MGALDAYLEAEFPAITTELRVLRLLARDAVAEFQASLDPGADSADLSEEDIVARLQDPRAFGRFARRVLDARVSREVKIGVAEKAFDVIPIPASEFSAVSVEERTPPGLLRLARFLLENEAFVVLHLLHLIYAAFLDLSVLRDSDRGTRAWVLLAVTARSELPETQRLLFAYQCLAAMGPRDGARALRGILGARHVARTVRSGLAVAASASDGGRAWFAAISEQEGLLPPRKESEASAVEFEARVPNLPEEVREKARRWLESRQGRDPP